MCRICFLFLLLLSVHRAYAQQTDRNDSVSIPMSDTLRSVVVTADGSLPMKLNPFGFDVMPHNPSLSEFIGSKATDKIMHPFAIRQRKKERHRKKMKQVLLDYDRETAERQLLLDALRAEGVDPDSLINASKEHR